MRINAYLTVRADTDGHWLIACRECAAVLGPAEQSYKAFAVEARRPLSELGTPYIFKDDRVSRFELREYYCPSCFVLLDSDVALKSDPVLHDVALRIDARKGG